MSVSDDAFRTELRSWLAEHPPPAVEVAATADDAAILREWQRTLHAGRWVGIHWPVEYGGRGASLTQVAIYNEELARAGAPPLLGRAGITLVGPTLMAHGTEAQRARWMPRILGARRRVVPAVQRAGRRQRPRAPLDTSARSAAACTV